MGRGQQIKWIGLGVAAFAVALLWGCKPPETSDGTSTSNEVAAEGDGNGLKAPENPEDAKDDEYVYYMTLRCNGIRIEELKQSCLADARTNIDQCSQTLARSSDESMRDCMDQYVSGYNPDD